MSRPADPRRRLPRAACEGLPDPREGQARRDRQRIRAFYVWPETDALWGFVAGDGFRGIVDSFGWTSIATWLTLAVDTRADVDFATVRAAQREQVDVRPGTDLAAWRRREIDANRGALAADARIVASVVAVDIARWRTVRFTLWACAPEELEDAPGIDRFEVLRLSAPGMRTAR